MTEIIIRTIITTVIGTVISGLIATMLKIYSDSKTMKSALLALLWGEIVDNCDKWKEKGYCPEEARICLQNLLAQYKNLNGNHGVDILVNSVFQLPLKPSYKRRKEDK